MSCCDCYSCLRSRRVAKILDGGDFVAAKALVEELLNALISAESQINYHESAWPHAEEIANRILERVAARKDPPQ